MPTMQQQPMTLEELLRLAGQSQLSQTPKLLSPSQQGYAPNGPQINFLGGATHPVNENPAILQNGMQVFQQVLEAIQRLRQGPTGGAPPGPATGGPPGLPQLGGPPPGPWR